MSELKAKLVQQNNEQEKAAQIGLTDIIIDKSLSVKIATVLASLISIVQGLMQPLIAVFFGSLVKTFDTQQSMVVYSDKLFSIGWHMIIIGGILFILGLTSGFIWQYVAKRQN